MSQKIKIFINPACSKCNEGLSILNENNCEIETIEYLTNTPDKAEMNEIIQLLGIKPQDLIRKNEEIYKNQFEGKVYTDSEWIDILLKFPILIERPIVVNGNKAIIGRPPKLILDII